MCEICEYFKQSVCSAPPVFFQYASEGKMLVFLHNIVGSCLGWMSQKLVKSPSQSECYLLILCLKCNNSYYFKLSAPMTVLNYQDVPVLTSCFAGLFRPAHEIQ